jgi:hypothetical protein
MLSRNTWVLLGGGVCLLSAGALVARLTLSPGHVVVHRVRVTDIADPSGRRLASIFEGVPLTVKYDVRGHQGHCGRTGTAAPRFSTV